MNRRRSHASPINDGGGMPGWLILLSGVVIGGFAMFIFELAERKGIGSDPSTNSASSSSQRNEKSVMAPVFEFYERLKQEQVEIPRYNPSSEESVNQTHEYYLQVASFIKQSDADNLRASLILLNLEASIEKSKLESGERRYRVLSGPYQSKSKLAKSQELLVSNGYDFLVRKREIER